MHDVRNNICFHCGLSLPGALPALSNNNQVSHPEYVIEIAGEQCAMCCFGCLCAAQTIVDAGLEIFYSNRDAFSESPDSLQGFNTEDLGYYDSSDFTTKYVHTESGSHEVTLMVMGISCTACAWLIEKTLRRSEHVNANMNAANHRLNLKWNPEEIRLSDIVQSIIRLGYRTAPYTVSEHEEAIKLEGKKRLKRLGVAGLGSMQVMMFAVGLYAGAIQGMMAEYEVFLRYVSMMVASVVVIYSARPFFYSAFRALKKLHFNMDLPVSIAIGLAYIASVVNTVFHQGEVYFDSVCMFTFFLLLTRHIEFVTRKKSYLNTLSQSYSLPQQYALLDEKLQIQRSVDVDQLVEGDLFQIKAGQTVPVDAVILSGQSSLDEALLTGEALPLLKQKGDTVYGGSDNIEAPLSVRTLKSAKDSTLFNIVRLIDRAQSEKPAGVRFADKIASFFVLGILLVASAVATLWWQLDSSRALAITLSVLVISCPCALALATPSAMAAAVSALAQKGFLITQGNALESLGEVTHVVFDKTGTITTGKLSLENISLHSALDENQVMVIANALEQHSEHPIAKVFTGAFEGKPQPGVHGIDIKIFPGRGVQGRVNDTLYRIGKLDFVLEQDFFNVTSKVAMKASMKSTVNDRANFFLATPNQIIAGFELADTLRPDAVETLQGLKQRGIEIHLLSGDPSPSVIALGHELGMDQVLNNALPAEKVTWIKNLQAKGAVVAMVGDGINDAPSLKMAQVSVAMGAMGEGADLAKTASDSIIMNRHLSTLLHAVDQAAYSKKIIRQNYSWAIIYNLSVLPLAASGMVAPYWSALGMSLSSLFVVLNSCRLLAIKIPKGSYPKNIVADRIQSGVHAQAAEGLLK